MIDLFVEYTKDVTSPVIFRKWAMIWAIGAAAERRVWTRMNINHLYPNIFTFLVGPPGTGKTQALKPAANILRKSGAVKLAPNDVTKQSLLDALKGSTKAVLVPGQLAPMDYHYMGMIVPELSNFMSKYDVDLAGLLTDLFDCNDTNDETRRTSKASGMIVNPGLSLIAGSATKNLGATISGDLWGQGFMARVILVHSAERIPPDPFKENDWDESIRDELVSALARIGEMVGPMTWDIETQKALKGWIDSGQKPMPTHAKLAEYSTRRWMHLAKLSMIAALADERMLVLLEDFELAQSWLFEAEEGMPEIFKDMNAHKDGDVMEELHHNMMVLWTGTKRPISAAWMWNYLKSKVAVHSIPRVIETMEAAELISRVGGTEGLDALYIPIMGSARDRLGSGIL